MLVLVLMIFVYIGGVFKYVIIDKDYMLCCMMSGLFEVLIFFV